ncbi:MAG: hypothetical protein ACKV2O_13170 [Acidimicrobiales bacterium]
MNEPVMVLSVLAVVLVWMAGPVGDAGDGHGPDSAECQLGPFGWLVPILAGAVLWGAVAVAADPLAEQLSVTAPTVRVAAGVALLVMSTGGIWAALRARAGDPAQPAATDTAPTLTSPWPLLVLASLLGGPVRVEVAVAVWSAALDHGRTAALLTVGALSARSALWGLWAALRRSGQAHHGPIRAPIQAPIRTLGRVAWCVAGTAVAALLAVNGVLGL